MYWIFILNILLSPYSNFLLKYYITSFIAFFNLRLLCYL